MLKQTISLACNYQLCSSCKGEYLRGDIPKVCPYLANFISDFLERRNNEAEPSRKWEQVRYYPEQGKGMAACSVKYQADLAGRGLVTVEATFKTEHNSLLKACSVHLTVKGGPEKPIMDGLVELLSKK